MIPEVSDAENSAEVGEVLPPSRRMDLLKLLEGGAKHTIFLKDIAADTLEEATEREMAYLKRFLQDDYFPAPAKSFLADKGVRVGYDYTGTYIHSKHLKRYYAVNVSGSVEDTLAAIANTQQQDSEVSETHLRRIIMSLFHMVDKDGSGTLNVAELGVLLRRAFPHLAARDVEKIFAQIDTNKSRDVSCEEFTTWVLSNEAGDMAVTVRKMIKNDRDAVFASFRVWDIDGDGGIAREELERVLKKICPSISKKQLELTFQSMDSDNDGKIDYAEFLDYILGAKQPEWQECFDADGRSYYHNTSTGVVQWEKPEGNLSEWQIYSLADGRSYYYNTTTCVSQWEKP
eukprot:gnl/TRDRNA2_/TRDRNA2_62964_c0_seq1.p1 gnl/TRDRNA2_/TRDRNA2_62964_c0~~gnl/TRDRNA2_/TRDRNA2_62964_c0_seq1.p1  ORF type:complete len:344 (+),score=58.04 gnl/TRDRNA2_/TRDRNA2_62964_c0_seq1:54-1085(+)